MATGIPHFNAKTTFSNPQLGGWSAPARDMPRVVSVAENRSYWGSIESEIETYLRQAIPIRPPESVFEPMHHLTFSAPRTTASSLCVAACEVVGGDRRQALAAASAIHLMHAAAYTHENLPLTDRPKSKSKPRVEHKYGPNVELLTGDGIIPFGLELLAGSMDQAQIEPARILQAIIEISRAGGSQGVVDGQYKEAGGSQGLEDDWDLEVIEYVCKKKEGEMHACGAACGAILGGAAEEEVEKLRNFGLYVGMVQGMIAKGNPLMEERIQKLKELAMKELGSFNGNTARLQFLAD